MIKLVMTWYVRDGLEAEYLEFLTKRFTKLLAEMGVQPTDAWYAAWGQGPQVIAGGVTSDRAKMRAALESQPWQTLNDELDRLVSGFEYKVVKAEGGFQL